MHNTPKTPKTGTKTLDDLTPKQRKAAEANLANMEQAASTATRQAFPLGDLLVKHVEEFGLRIDVAVQRLAKYGKGRSTLRKYEQVSRSFRSPASREGLSWFIAYEAVKEWNRAALDFRSSFTPEQIARKGLKLGKSARQLRTVFNEQEKAVANAAARDRAARDLAAHPWLKDACFHDDCLNVLPKIPDGTARLIWSDPPYHNYRGTERGTLRVDDTYCPAARCDYAPMSQREAEDLVIRSMELSLPKLVPCGCLVLWQAGGAPPSWRVLKAAEEQGWAMPFMGFWDKGIAAMGRLDQPFAISAELFLIYWRQGDGIVDCTAGASSRREVIDAHRIADFFERRGMGRLQYETVTRESHRLSKKGDAKAGDWHIWQKPDGLNRFFLSKLTHEGDLVVDLFGCSGSMPIAAGQMGRRWVYVEKDQINYHWGVSRISEALGSEGAGEAA